jgi:aryl-alcohol dehydrogenase-like predicted oxidoreductase
MRYRELGRTGLELSVVGFGAWAVGGPWAWGWGSQHDGDSMDALHRALDAGVNWIDTAAAYGLGHSERVVGRALRERRDGDEIRIATKCGLWADGDRDVYDLRPSSIRREVDASRRRLGVDVIDLFQIHWPDTATGTSIEESWTTMAELVTEGAVRHVGVSNFSVELLERCEPIHHVDSLQPPLSLIDRSALAELLPWCMAHGTGVICYSPMQSGLLTGAFSHQRAASLPSDDWRWRDQEFQEPRLSANLAVADRLRPVAARHGAAVAATAVAWVLGQAGVTAAIVGARSPGQVDGWIGAGDLLLTPDDLAELEAGEPASGEAAPLGGVPGADG